MNAGNLNFGISIDKESLRRQVAEAARDAHRQGKSAGAGYGHSFSRSADLGGGIDRNLRTTLPQADRHGRAAGSKFGESFSRAAKPKVDVDLSRADSSLNSFIGSVKGKFSGLGSTFQSIMTGASTAIASSIISLIGGAISSVTNGIKSAVGEIYRIGTAAEATKTSLTAVIGNAKTAATVIKEIQTLSAATPFTSGELVGGAKSLIASGIAAGDVANKIKQIGNAAALARKEGQSLGVSFNEVVNIVAKVNSVGKLTGETYAQFTERSINLNAEIAKILGVQTSEVQQLISEGKVSKEVFEQAFTAFTEGGGKATGQMDALSKTTEGVWSTFQEGIEQGAVSIFNMMQPALNEVLNQLMAATAETGKTSTAMDSLGKIANRFTEFLKQNPEIIREIVQAVSDFVDNQMAKLVQQAEQFLEYLEKNPQAIQEAITAISEFNANLATTLDSAGKLWNMVTSVLGTLKEWGTALDDFAARLGVINPMRIGEAMNGEGFVMADGNEGFVNNQKVTRPDGGDLHGAGNLQPHHDGKTHGLSGLPKYDMTIRDRNTGSYKNQPIRSPINGYVSSVQPNNGDAGNMLTIKDDAGQQVILMHLKTFAVKAGQRIGEGMVLGIQGFTGSPKGEANTHVHIEAQQRLIDKFIKINNGTLAPNPTTSAPSVLSIPKNYEQPLRIPKDKQAVGGQRNPTRAKSAAGMTPYEEGFLAAIRFGESDKGGKRQNKAVGVQTPAGKAQGAYQLMPGTRNAVKNKTGLDAWAKDDETQDKAALAWIDMYGKEKGINIRGMINQGKFSEAAKILGKNQWTSLPGGAEASPKWKTQSLSNFKLGSGQAFTSPTVAQASAAQANVGRARAAGIEVPKSTTSQVDKAARAAAKKKEANDKLYVANKRKGDAKAKAEAEQAAKEAADALKALNEEIASGIGQGVEFIREAQSTISRASDPNRAKLDSEIQGIKDKYEDTIHSFEDQINAQRELINKVKDPKQRKQIEGNIKSLDALINATKGQRDSEIETRELALMMENAKKAEEELAEKRARRVEDERAYNDALFAYLEAQKQKGEAIKNAIKVYQENLYESKKGQALGMAQMLTSDASVLSARAANTTDINAQAAMNREAGLMNIQADVTQQLSAIDDLARSGQFANSQIERMRANVLALGQMRVDGLKTEFKDLSGIIGQELQSSFGNFLSALLTGSQTASEALQGLVNQLLSALANLAIKQLLGGLFGGGAGGLLGFAGGTGMGNVGHAMQKEHQQSGGRKPVMAILNQDEVVLNARQAKEYRAMMSRPVMNFAAGTMPALPSSTGGAGTTNVTVPVTVNGGNGAGLNTPAFQREIEQVVTSVIIKHQTQSGGLMKGR